LLLRDFRRAAGLTQEELAERAGVSVRSISDLERSGAHVPRRDTVSLLVQALDLPQSERAVLEAAVHRRRGPRPNMPTRDSGQPSAPQRPRDDVARGNLPRLLNSFVGRKQELRELRELLGQTPLLTFVGAGGVGKTRLALELVRDQTALYPDG